MDSLLTSAIALAAGGWSNIKLVGIYTQLTYNILTWKLGICAITFMPGGAVAHNSQNAWATAAIGPHSTTLVSPGSSISYIVGITQTSATADLNRSFLNFTTSAITGSNPTGGSDFVALLFTW